MLFFWRSTFHDFLKLKSEKEEGGSYEVRTEEGILKVEAGNLRACARVDPEMPPKKKRVFASVNLELDWFKKKQ